MSLANLLSLAGLLATVAIEARGETPRPTHDEWKDSQAKAAAAADAAAAKQAKTAAVDKALSMLENLKTQVLSEGEAEAATYNKFACFCKDATKEKTEAIKKGQDEKAALSSDIEELASQRDKLDDTIAQEQDMIATTEQELADATRQRQKTLKEYGANSADLQAALDALEGAISTLKASKQPSLLQFQSVSRTLRTALQLADALGTRSKARRAIESFLQEAPDVPMEDYKFHSNDLIKTLEELLADFQKEKQEVDQTEVESVATYDRLMQEKTNVVKTSTLSLEGAKKDRATKMEEIAFASQQLTTVAAVLLDDQEYMRNLAKMCSDKAKTWDQRTAVRADELSTLTEAIGIIRGKVHESTSAATIRFAQQGMSVRVAQAIAGDSDAMSAIEAAAEAADGPALSFLQRRPQEQGSAMAVRKHDVAGGDDGRDTIVALLRGKGQQLKSTFLTSLANRIAGDPFAKIKTLIQELIERLLQEAANEANQKGWCDKATADAEQKRGYAAGDILALNGEMARLEATRDQLALDLRTLGEEIADLKAKHAEADAEREAESKENAATIKEAEEGKDALDMCIDLLDKFYKTVKKTKVDLSLVQRGDPMEDAPDAGFEIGEAYTGAQSEMGGILGMLDVMKSDFQRTISETETAEAEAEEAHLEFTTETQKSLAVKTQAETEKTEQKNDAETKLGDADESLHSETKILETSIKELLELKPACVDTGMSYEERVARREDEIEALKKAQCILSNYAQYGPEGAADGC